jgi:hypothetical protein
LDWRANVHKAAASLGNLVREQWLPVSGAVLTLAMLTFAPVLAVPLQAFLEFCFGEAVDGNEMSGGLLMWFTMRPEWSVATLGVCLVAIGVLIKSSFTAQPKPARSGFAAQQKPARASVAVQPKPVSGLDENTLYAAMIWSAEVTGGFTPEQLATMFEDLTGLKAPKWGRTFALTEQSRPHPAMVVILDKVKEKHDQRTIMALVLAVCLHRNKLTKQARQLIWLLAAKFQMTKAEVRELYESVRSGNQVAEAA